MANKETEKHVHILRGQRKIGKDAGIPKVYELELLFLVLGEPLSQALLP